MPKGLVNKGALNVGQIFQHYLTFCGDTKRTAVALNMSEDTVKALALEEKWQDAIREWNELRDGSAQDVQVQISRGVNFVQAHRLRMVIDRLVSYFTSRSEEELIKLLTKTTKDGSEFTTRPVTDLVKGAEAVQGMIQRALGDTAADKSKAGKDSGNIALVVMRAMQAAEHRGLSSVEVVRKELAPARLAEGTTNATKDTECS